VISRLVYSGCIRPSGQARKSFITIDICPMDIDDTVPVGYARPYRQSPMSAAAQLKTFLLHVANNVSNNTIELKNFARQFERYE